MARPAERERGLPVASPDVRPSSWASDFCPSSWAYVPSPIVCPSFWASFHCLCDLKTFFFPEKIKIIIFSIEKFSRRFSFSSKKFFSEKDLEKFSKICPKKR